LTISACLLIPVTAAEGWQHKHIGHHHVRPVVVPTGVAPAGLFTNLIGGFLNSGLGQALSQEAFNQLLKALRDQLGSGCTVDQEVVTSLDTIDNTLASIQAKLDLIGGEAIPAPETTARKGVGISSVKPKVTIVGPPSLQAVQKAVVLQSHTLSKLVEHHNTLQKHLNAQTAFLAAQIQALQRSQDQHLTEMSATLKAMLEELKKMKKGG